MVVSYPCCSIGRRIAANFAVQTLPEMSPMPRSRKIKLFFNHKADKQGKTRARRRTVLGKRRLAMS